jgi:hypothetical protein
LGAFGVLVGAARARAAAAQGAWVAAEAGGFAGVAGGCGPDARALHVREPGHDGLRGRGFADSAAAEAASATPANLARVGVEGHAGAGGRHRSGA